MKKLYILLALAFCLTFTQALEISPESNKFTQPKKKRCKHSFTIEFRDKYVRGKQCEYCYKVKKDWRHWVNLLIYAGVATLIAFLFYWFILTKIIN